MVILFRAILEQDVTATEESRLLTTTQALACTMLMAGSFTYQSKGYPIDQHQRCNTGPSAEIMIPIDTEAIVWCAVVGMSVLSVSAVACCPALWLGWLVPSPIC